MITKVAASNFLSWDKMEFSVEDGVTLIDGWNEDDQTSEGSGKSAILNALSWCLYGKIPKDANIDEVVKTGKKSCGVQVTLSDGTSVIRTRGPNNLLIVKGDEHIKGKDARETQLLIEALVGLTFETFCQTVYFAQNYDKKFITANQEDKAKILSEVQDLNLFDKARKEVQTLLKLSEDNLTSLKHKVDLLNKDAQLVEKDIQFEEAMIEEQRLQKERHLADLDARLTRVTTQIENYTAQMTSIIEKYEQIAFDENDVNTLNDEISALRVSANSLQKQIIEIDSTLRTRAQKEASGQKYGQRYKKLVQDRERAEDFIKNPSKDCPTCGPKLEGCDTSHAQKDLSNVLTEMQEIMSLLETISQELSEPAPIKDELQAQFAEINGEILRKNSKLSELNSAKTKRIQLTSQLAEIDVVVKNAIEDQANINLEILQVREAAQDALDLSKLNALKTKRQTLFEELTSVGTLVTEKQEHIIKLNSLKDGFKEVKSHVFNSLLNEINARVNRYLIDLFNVPASIKFVNDNMKIETQVTLDGVPRALGLLSGGQFRRFSLAVDLALSDTITNRKNSKFGILILDEYFKDLSENSMEKCLALLQKRNQPVLLIEHNSIFKSIVDNSFFVTLRDGTTSAQV